MAFPLPAIIAICIGSENSHRFRNKRTFCLIIFGCQCPECRHPAQIEIKKSLHLIEITICQHGIIRQTCILPPEIISPVTVVRRIIRRCSRKLRISSENRAVKLDREIPPSASGQHISLENIALGQPISKIRIFRYVHINIALLPEISPPVPARLQCFSAEVFRACRFTSFSILQPMPTVQNE